MGQSLEERNLSLDLVHTCFDHHSLPTFPVFYIFLLLPQNELVETLDGEHLSCTCFDALVNFA